MSNTAMVCVRIEPDLKKKAEKVFRKLGITATEAITLFYHEVEIRKGIPFRVEIPNKETRQAMKDSTAGRNLVRCKNVEDMFKKLSI